MKLLITGKPKSGKSTVLSGLIGDVYHKRGIITTETIGADGVRTGFIVEDNKGHNAFLAQTANATNIKVGRFYVHPEVLASFTKSLLAYKKDELLYIDEIGQMQLYSNDFKKILTTYLEAPNDFMATITSIYSNSLIEQILKRKDTILFHITEHNRGEIKECLVSAKNNRESFNRLTDIQKAYVVDRANKYLANNSYISFNKLFNNAINYVLNLGVNFIGNDKYIVYGNTSQHTVKCDGGKWECDCPLSNGLKPFKRKMACSHIQAVMLIKLDANSKQN